jgi:hypothetical protein
MAEETVQPVFISYKALLQEDLTSLYDDITKGFGSGPDCLGLIILKDLPEKYSQLREDALLAAYQFASLPKDIQDKYVDPESSYMFGWSHGKGTSTRMVVHKCYIMLTLLYRNYERCTR